jgi:cytochrome c-type biogenesis protein CcmH
MMLWFVLTIMTSVAAVLVAAPFIRPFDDRRQTASGDVAVYKDQLAEVEREAADGAIGNEQVEATRIEIKRRLLAADRDLQAAPKMGSPFERNFATIAVSGIVVLGAISLYAITGRPDVPSQDHSRRPARGADPVVALASATQGDEAGPRPTTEQRLESNGMQGAAGHSLPTVDDMIQRLVDRLQRQPNDANGWRMLGWSYFTTDRFAESAEAYARAVALLPKVGSLRTSQGEALVRAAHGEVKPDALAIFDAALKLDAKDLRARFFKGLAKEQTGEKSSALKDWIAVLKDAGPDDRWAPDLRQRVSGLAQELGEDISADLGTEAAASQPASGGALAVLQQRQVAANPAPAPVQKDPDADDVRNAETMTPADRSAMIRGMVEGLASRLQQLPRDADGWIQLIRSRKVLGEPDAAKRALALALQIFADAPQEQGRISSAAAAIGVTQ